MSSLHNVVKTLMCSTSEDLECQLHICHASISNSSQYILQKKKKNLIVALEERSGDHHSGIYPLGNMNICTQFCANPTSKCQYILMNN